MLEICSACNQQLLRIRREMARVVMVAHSADAACDGVVLATKPGIMRKRVRRFHTSLLYLAMMSLINF
jgi:hypothetical protein